MLNLALIQSTMILYFLLFCFSGLGHQLSQHIERYDTSELITHFPTLNLFSVRHRNDARVEVYSYALK